MVQQKDYNHTNMAVGQLRPDDTSSWLTTSIWVENANKHIQTGPSSSALTAPSTQSFTGVSTHTYLSRAKHGLLRVSALVVL